MLHTQAAQWLLVQVAMALLLTRTALAASVGMRISAICAALGFPIFGLGSSAHAYMSWLRCAQCCSLEPTGCALHDFIFMSADTAIVPCPMLRISLDTLCRSARG